jgi:hypothetical protein
VATPGGFGSARVPASTYRRYLLSRSPVWRPGFQRAKPPH